MKKISGDIKAKKFEHAYLLFGEETYLRDQYRQMLVRALIPEGDSMNLTRYEGRVTDLREIISQADTMPFFAEHRVILMENTGVFKYKADELADYMKNLPDYLVFIFTEDEVDKRSRMYKAVKKYGYVAEFGEQKEEVLTRWVLGMLKKENKKIRRSALEQFLTMTGTDMGNIRQEMEKLLCYTMDKDEVTEEDIQAVCTPQITNRIFDMVRAVSEHRQKEALKMYYELLALKEPPMRILYLLARQFNQMYQVKGLMEQGMRGGDIAGKVGMPPFAVRRLMPICRKYETEELCRTVEDFVQTETDVKTGKLDGEISVELMIVKYSAAHPQPR